MFVTQTNAQSKINRWSVAAAIFAGSSNLLCLILLLYQGNLNNEPLVLNYPEIISYCWLASPLLVVIVFRHVAAFTLTYALILSLILAGRIYYLVQFYRVGVSAFVPKMDVPGLGLILLGAISLVILLISALTFVACFINNALKSRGNTDG